MSGQRPIRILLVEDHALFRKAVALLLRSEADFALVGEAASGPEAVRQAVAVNPDVILMDIALPEMDGIEATRRIKALLPEARIVMLTATDADETLFEAVRSGAQGYLLKEVEAETLIQTVRAVMRGEAYLPGPLAAKMLAEFARPASRTVADSPSPVLSPREEAVLEHVAHGKSNKEIAAVLGVAENTVRNHLRHILRKLHLANRVQAATYALRQRIADKPPKTNR
jgi:DNA-binding NarL/FixJ family response regulator